MPSIVSDTRSDGIYTHLTDPAVAYTKEIEYDRIIDYAADGTPVGIDLLGVSNGVDLADLPNGDVIFGLWMQLLNQQYKTDNWPEVSSYLKANPFLVGILLEAPGKIEEHFGPNALLNLEIFTDPEDEGSQELFALIKTHFAPEQALQQLAELDREWWLEISGLARCQLNLDIRYVALHQP